jgi:hypothetical protein
MPRSGRPRACNEAVSQKAMDVLVEKTCRTPSQAVQHLCSLGVLAKPVHRTTLVRAAKRQAAASGSILQCVTGAPKQGLKAASKARRVEFAKKMKRRGMVWKRVMFTDRKKFLFKHPGCAAGRRHWVKDKDTPTAYTVSHPQCYNVYAGITYFGVTGLYAVAGTSKHQTVFTTKQGKPARNITAAEYKHILVQHLLPAGREIFSRHGLDMWFFQQDNDPSHKRAGDHIKGYSRQHSCHTQLLPDWPPNSPDLNLIENVWAWVDGRVQNTVCNSFEEFKKAVDMAFASIPQSMLHNCFASMDKRLQLCMERGGDWTGY